MSANKKRKAASKPAPTPEQNVAAPVSNGAEAIATRDKPADPKQQSVLSIVLLPVVLLWLVPSRIYVYSFTLFSEACVLLLKNQKRLYEKIRNVYMETRSATIKRVQDTKAYGVKLYEMALAMAKTQADKVSGPFKPLLQYAKNVFDFAIKWWNRVTSFVKQVFNATVMPVITWAHNLWCQARDFAISLIALARALVRRVQSTAKGLYHDVAKPGVENLIKIVRTRVNAVRTRAMALYTQTWVAAVVKTTVAQAHSIIEIVQKQMAIVMQQIMALFERVKARGQTETGKVYQSAFNFLQGLPFLRRIKAD
jgi:ABC-type multidrug transport system fused ATPase/permease subunit